MIDRLKYSMQALQMLTRAQEVVANNMANINTPGFKGDKLFFRAFQDAVGGRHQITPQETLQMHQGPLESTGNPFDLAIHGDGFFEVEKDGNLFLTRDGRFQLDAGGYLVDSNGGKVQGISGPIQLTELMPSGNGGQRNITVDISQDGTVRVNDKIRDQISLVQVDDVSSLRHRTNAYFEHIDDDQLQPDINSEIQQGFYENSNVDPLQEMVKMTKNARLFESQQRALRTSDELLSRVTTQLGKF